jgi:hypothetical protein
MQNHKLKFHSCCFFKFSNFCKILRAPAISRHSDNKFPSCFAPVNSIYLPGTITFSHLAVKKWSLAWATREQWRQFSTPFPRHIVRQFQSLYTPSPRGLIATPYSTSVSVPLHAITARSITNQLASSGVSIGFTFLPHVIIPDKRHGVHCFAQAKISFCREISLQVEALASRAYQGGNISCTLYISSQSRFMKCDQL